MTESWELTRHCWKFNFMGIMHALISTYRRIWDEGSSPFLPASDWLDLAGKLGKVPSSHFSSYPHLIFTFWSYEVHIRELSCLGYGLVYARSISVYDQIWCRYSPAKRATPLRTNVRRTAGTTGLLHNTFYSLFSMQQCR